MRDHSDFLAGAAGADLVAALAEQWIVGEQILHPDVEVDRRSAATRRRYAEITTRSNPSGEARAPSRKELKAIKACTAAFVTWTAGYGARQLVGWMQDALRDGHTTPNQVRARVRREITELLARQGVGVVRLRKSGRFDDDNLDAVIERGRTQVWGNFG